MQRKTEAGGGGGWPGLSLGSALPGMGKKEKIRKGMTHSSAKAKSTPMMSIRIFSDTLGVQNITKQSWWGEGRRVGVSQVVRKRHQRVEKARHSVSRGAQREGDLPKQEPGMPVRRPPSPSSVLSAGTGPAHLPHLRLCPTGDVGALSG